METAIEWQLRLVRWQFFATLTLSLSLSLSLSLFLSFSLSLFLALSQLFWVNGSLSALFLTVFLALSQLFWGEWLSRIQAEFPCGAVSLTVTCC